MWKILEKPREIRGILKRSVTLGVPQVGFFKLLNLHAIQVTHHGQKKSTSHEGSKDITNRSICGQWRNYK